MSRTVAENFASVEQEEGMGAKVHRSIGKSEHSPYDPFLLLDEFRVAAPAGFPDHPHRGFETVTYMLSGQFRHEDFCGHKGIISAGDVQWMTAGRGIVHCEMPHGREIAHGLQLWVNLRKQEKMVTPRYQELLHKDIPVATRGGVTIKVIAGEAFGVKAAVHTYTPIMYLDVTMIPASKLILPIPKDWNSCAYILNGEAYFGHGEIRQRGPSHNLLRFNMDGEHIEVVNQADLECRFVVLAGKPLGEQVVQHGPFVMNTTVEVKEAMKDYQLRRNGFENARSWSSSFE